MRRGERREVIFGIALNTAENIMHFYCRDEEFVVVHDARIERFQSARGERVARGYALRNTKGVRY